MLCPPAGGTVTVAGCADINGKGATLSPLVVLISLGVAWARRTGTSLGGRGAIFGTLKATGAGSRVGATLGLGETRTAAPRVEPPSPRRAASRSALAATARGGGTEAA
jgi:hypothetical protein